jgi:hypothetical protein
MTTINTITPIHGKNISEAWAHALVRCMDAGGRILAPGIVSFDVKEEDNSWKLETSEIRQALDNQLSAFGIVSANQSNVETVAGTIFPESIWKRCCGNREKLFKEYEKMWPLISKCKRAANVRGTYFRRLTAFGEKGTNQLEKIINAWNNGTHRHSALQAGIFDPTQDHRETPFLGFPCLQQVVFHPIGPKGKGGMTVVAFYAKQLLLEKAYGNYLGLYRLGEFMAGEMGMRLRRVTCIASDLSLSDKHGKRECLPLVERIKKALTDGN